MCDMGKKGWAGLGWARKRKEGKDDVPEGLAIPVFHDWKGETRESEGEI
jgi:hypothetical protein